MKVSAPAKYYSQLADLLLGGDQLLGSATDVKALPATRGMQHIILTNGTFTSTDPCDGWAANIEGGTDRLGQALTFARAVHALGKKALFAPSGADLELWMLVNTQTGAPIASPTQTQKDDNVKFNALVMELEEVCFQAQQFYGPNSSRKLTLEQTALRVKAAADYIHARNATCVLSAQLWMPNNQTTQQVIDFGNYCEGWLELLGLAGPTSSDLGGNSKLVIQGLNVRKDTMSRQVKRAGIPVGAVVTTKEEAAAIVKQQLENEESLYTVEYVADAVVETVTSTISVSVQ